MGIYLIFIVTNQGQEEGEGGGGGGSGRAIALMLFPQVDDIFLLFD